MKSWHGTGSDTGRRYITEIRRLRLSTIENAVILSLLLMCLISAVDAMTGRNIGNPGQLQMAQQQAQQELMALRTKAE